MRLIDADKLIDYIEPGHLRQPGELCFSEIDVVNMINNTPTAYDIDNVVNQLEMGKKTAFDLVKLPHFFIKNLQKLVDICFDRAIEIVKAGGL
ncbi:MAG: hypothetical protein Q4E78_03945 [Eubacteriales bacterium]|nr:hypothetical protein [Eubacteriales bacterium]